MQEVIGELGVDLRSVFTWEGAPGYATADIGLVGVMAWATGIIDVMW